METKLIKNTRDNLPKFLKKMGFKIGAEIGVYKAAFTDKFCKEGFKMYGIDPYHSYTTTGRVYKDDKRQQFLYEHAHRVLKKYNDCTIIRKTSMDAVKMFRDSSLDFVYIDGDHSFSHVAEDIQAWAYKVKKGGIVAGHDYCANVGGIEKNINQVGPVIDAYVKAFNVKKLYVFGNKDHASSWFFVR